MDVQKKILVWDLPTRIFHWSLVVLFVVVYLSGENGNMDLHFKASYILAGLLLFRIIWGFTGSTYARFSNFIKSPMKAIKYLKSAVTGNHEHYLGHNPAGGWMVIAMLVLLTLQILSGMANSDDIFLEGPLYSVLPGYMTELAHEFHEIGQGILVPLIVIHVLVIIAYKVGLKENLITPMITGKKNGDGEPYKGGSFWILLPLSIICIGLSSWLFINY